MKDAGNIIQMYQERIERLERALDLCREQRDEHAGLRDISDLTSTDYELKEEPKKKRIITYFRYFYVYAHNRGVLHYTGYSTEPWDSFTMLNRILVDTETKTVEVDDEK